MFIMSSFTHTSMSAPPNTPTTPATNTPTLFNTGEDRTFTTVWKLQECETPVSDVTPVLGRLVLRGNSLILLAYFNCRG